MTLLKIAWRNLRRNLRRNLITGTAISFGLLLLLLSDGLSVGTFNAMIDVGVSQMAGHVVVQGPDYQEQREADIIVPNTLEIEKKLKENIPEGTVLKRIFLDGLLNSPTGSVGIGLTAVDVNLEKGISDLHTKMLKGEYLDGGDSQIVIGVGLAETLAVDIGDKVVLMSNREGEIESRLFRVKGIFRTAQDQMDGFFAQIPLHEAQDLLGLGSNVNQISVHLPTVKGAEEATALAKSIINDPNLEILVWYEALPEIKQFIDIKLQSNYMLMSVIGFIVCIGILNTSLMSVLERMREFGVLLAIGMAPIRIAALVLLEATLLGITSVTVGMTLGLSLNHYLSIVGIDYSEMMGESMEAGGVGISTHMFAATDWHHVIVFGIISLALSILAALYPAIKAARLEPIEAMHHV